MKPEFEMIVLANTSSDPRTVMVVLSHTFSTKIAVFTTILFSAVANIAKIVLVRFVVKKLIFLNRTSLKAWVFSNS
jgi:hypothetical protein